LFQMTIIRRREVVLDAVENTWICMTKLTQHDYSSVED
jgi:hypothetical protein